jgi:hypothetical protein
MRFISPDMFLDEWFGCLDPIQRLLWIGLLTSCADDQGRFINNPVLIRVRIFPYDPSITKEQIQEHLDYFKESRKIISLQFGQNGATKECMQISNWWKYQKHTHWAAPSELPAPADWTDRVRSHLPGHGTKPVAQNWDQAGGFHKDTQPLRSDNVAPTKPLRSREDEEESESEEEVKDKDESESSSVLEDSPATQTTTACLAIFMALGATPVQIKYLGKTPGIDPADIWAMAAMTWNNPKVRKPAYITLQNILSGEKASADWYQESAWSSIPAAIRQSGGIDLQGQEKNENKYVIMATRKEKETKIKTEAERVWQVVKDQLGGYKPEGNLRGYIQDTHPVSLSAQLLQVAVPDSTARDWLNARATKTINRLLIGICNQPDIKVEFVGGETP